MEEGRVRERVWVKLVYRWNPLWLWYLPSCNTNKFERYTYRWKENDDKKYKKNDGKKWIKNTVMLTESHPTWLVRLPVHGFRKSISSISLFINCVQVTMLSEMRQKLSAMISWFFSFLLNFIRSELMKVRMILAICECKPILKATSCLCKVSLSSMQHISYFSK